MDVMSEGLLVPARGVHLSSLVQPRDAFYLIDVPRCQGENILDPVRKVTIRYVARANDAALTRRQSLKMPISL